MDPISQGVLGAGFAQTQARGPVLVTAGLLGAMSGMAPDLDVLIQSSTDPLLFLEYHRQFTHALIFIPIGALICALVGYYFARRRLSFAQTYLFCFLGYATHALLDACTSYGTQLFWPFSNQRVDWSNVSVVDPLFTLPLLVAVVLAARRQHRWIAVVGLCWALSYLSLGVIQRERAETVARQLAEDRGLSLVGLEVKPSFASLLLWRAIAETSTHYYIDGVRLGFGEVVFPGDILTKLDVDTQFPWLDTTTQQAEDLRRFSWFSQGYLAVHPSEVNTLVDARYSMLPNGLESLWQVTLDPDLDPQAHIHYQSVRNTSPEILERFYSMLVSGVDPVSVLPQRSK